MIFPCGSKCSRRTRFDTEIAPVAGMKINQFLIRGEFRICQYDTKSDSIAEFWMENQIGLVVDTQTDFISTKFRLRERQLLFFVLFDGVITPAMKELDRLEHDEGCDQGEQPVHDKIWGIFFVHLPFSPIVGLLGS